jgi:hypothetical protein
VLSRSGSRRKAAHADSRDGVRQTHAALLEGESDDVAGTSPGVEARGQSASSRGGRPVRAALLEGGAGDVAEGILTRRCSRQQGRPLEWRRGGRAAEGVLMRRRPAGWCSLVEGRRLETGVGDGIADRD